LCLRLNMRITWVFVCSCGHLQREEQQLTVLKGKGESVLK
jgi:hypothetical protein